MPVVTFDANDLRRLLGKDVPTAKLAERMPMIGGDLDRVEGDQITIEWFPDRPDLLTPEGTARALRAFLDIQPGLPSYGVGEASTTLTVDASVQQVRPYAALCFVRGVPFDEALVQAVVDAQEKLCMAPGRRRRKIAIGVHDASDVSGPFTYTAVGPDEKPFVPLKESRQMTPAQIIAEHPKGQEYGHLLDGRRFPVFLDGTGAVLSMPPVINAARTTITAATREVLLDVTGTDREAVDRTMALLATGLADRGGTIEAVTVHDARGAWTCPDLHTTEQTIHADDVDALLGLGLDGPAVARCLERMGHAAEAFDNRILVQSPAWRFDLMHPVDWIEDVAIGYGFDNFPGSLPTSSTFGAALGHQDTEDRLRDVLCGLGLSEAKTLTLSNPQAQYGAWGAAPDEAVQLLNPVLEEQTQVRTRLVPGLLHILSQNRHRPLPQRLWEIGEVVEHVDGAWPNRLRLAAVETSARAGFADAKGLVEAVLRDMQWQATLRAGHRPGFIASRQGEIVKDDAVVGHFGELHPDTIVAFGLGAATTVMELDVEAFL